jgi:hypothetical protein
LLDSDGRPDIKSLVNRISLRLAFFTIDPLDTGSNFYPSRASLWAICFAFREREMSSPAIISSGTDRTTRLGGPLGVGNARPRSKAQVRQALQIAATISVLMLIMLGGLALRAVLALTQGIQ